MKELILVVVGIIIYILGYHYIVHGRFSCNHTGISVNVKPCKIVMNNIFDKNALFNPSMTVKGDRLVTIHRHTPGHQLGAAVAYLDDGENGFEVNGIKYRERACIGWGFNPSEPVFVPIDIFPWQWENGIWKQGEDIRLISPTECITVFPYMIRGKLMSRLVRCRIIRDTTSKKLILEPVKILSPYGESHKNWVCLSPRTYLTDAFPRWVVRGEDDNVIIDIDTKLILRKLDIKISPTIHLGGCVCQWSSGTMIIAMHTTRPYRNILCEISSISFKPVRFTHPLQLSESRETFIENVTGLAHHKSKLYIGWGYEDRQSRFTILSREKVEKLLCVYVGEMI